MKIDTGIFRGMELDILTLTSNSINSAFNKKGIRAFFTRLRYPLFLAIIIIIILRIKPNLFFPATCISLFGELLQLWCFSSLDKNKNLTNRGPYAFTRNPMYIGRFFVLFGFLLLIGDIWVIVIYSILYYFYVINRIKREEARLRSLFKESYENYCRQVNRFLPSFTCFNRKSLLFFKRSLLIQNHGGWNFVAVLSCYLMFGLLAVE
jgi:hypothetical protein